MAAPCLNLTNGCCEQLNRVVYSHENRVKVMKIGMALDAIAFLGSLTCAILGCTATLSLSSGAIHCFFAAAPSILFLYLAALSKHYE